MLLKRKVCVVLVDRANYGRLRPVMEALRAHESVELQVVCGGTLVLERFGSAVNVLRQDGFNITSEVYMELEGSTPATMAKSVGLGVIEFTNEFQRLKPDVVVMIGDRYEALGAAIAAAYMNLTLVHIQGGEVSGSIDESARHAISKFAQYHVPSTARAAEFLIRMGEREDSILTIGCPSSDIARALDTRVDLSHLNHAGSGAHINFQEPYLLALFHPTTTEFGGEAAQMEALMGALNDIRKPTLLLWPNIDAGSDHISKVIRRFRDQFSTNTWMRVLTNLDPETYLQVLSRATCAIGNSSSFVRDASYFGTPVVLVGNRQAGRERGAHVTHVPPTQSEIFTALNAQLRHGRYASSTLYGDGNVGPRVAEAVAQLSLYSQKQLAYVQEENLAAA